MKSRLSSEKFKDTTTVVLEKAVKYFLISLTFLP